MLVIAILRYGKCLFNTWIAPATLTSTSAKHRLISFRKKANQNKALGLHRIAIAIAILHLLHFTPFFFNIKRNDFIEISNLFFLLHQFIDERLTSCIKLMILTILLLVKFTFLFFSNAIIKIIINIFIKWKTFPF